MREKVALVAPRTISHRTAEETIALGYLGAILRGAGYEVVLVDAWLRDLSCDEVANLIFDKSPPAVVCLSCYRSNMEQAKEILNCVKARSVDTAVICGGYGPTFHDEEFLKAGFDVALRGEAEELIVPLVESLISKRDLSQIPGISFLKDEKIVRTEKASPVSNLDTIPFPARDEITETLRRRNPVHLCTSRGCNGNCSFCSIAAFNQGATSKRWRGRSVADIVGEIQHLNERFGVTHFKIVDDSFLEPPRDESWTFAFSEALRKLNLKIRFRTQVRADRLTEEIVQDLKSAGWFATSIGVENFSPNPLARMGKTASVEDNLRALELLHKYGIYAQVGLILFDNLTTMKELAENCEMLARHGWIVTKGIFTEMFAAEGTRFTSGLQQARLLKKDAASQNYSYEIEDLSARRVYLMLKMWHKSHAAVYDWVIDSITAPKVLSDEGYKNVHALCARLLALDVRFFKKTILWVQGNEPGNDKMVVEDEIKTSLQEYAKIRSRIEEIYSCVGLVYDGVLNPFLV